VVDICLDLNKLWKAIILPPFVGQRPARPFLASTHGNSPALYIEFRHDVEPIDLGAIGEVTVQADLDEIASAGCVGQLEHQLLDDAAIRALSLSSEQAPVAPGHRSRVV
jgi:hypothetical protein